MSPIMFSHPFKFNMSHAGDFASSKQDTLFIAKEAFVQIRSNREVLHLRLAAQKQSASSHAQTTHPYMSRLMGHIDQYKREVERKGHVYVRTSANS